KEIWDRSSLQCPGCEVEVLKHLRKTGLVIRPKGKEPKIRKCPSCKNMFITDENDYCPCGAKVDRE
ncbi:hypothetical protein LCGC14_0841910, partial [marine sediment metagenome]